MATDIYKTVLYNDGEELTYGDLNNSEGNVLAKAIDSLLPLLVSNYLGADVEFTAQLPDTGLSPTSARPATIPTTPYCYVANPGQAYPYQGSANNKIKIAAGTLYQLIAQPDGSEPKLLSFTFDGTTELTIAN